MAAFPKVILASFVCSAFADMSVAAAEQNAVRAERAGGEHAESCPTCAGKTAVPAAGGPGSAQKSTVLELFGGTPLRLVEDNSLQFSVERIVGKSGTPIPIKIRLPSPSGANAGAQATYTFLMFRGIPDGMSLSSGFRTRNAWMVSISEIDNLSLFVPPKFQGDFPIDILFYNGEAAAPAKLSIFIHVLSSNDADAPANQTAGVPPSAKEAIKAPAHGPAGTSKTEEDDLLRQAQVQLQNGNIVFARLLFEQLAAHGSAQGAFAVAQTYDPAVLEQIGAVGVRGDVELAKYWYRKAAELGNVPTSDVLSALRKDRR